MSSASFFSDPLLEKYTEEEIRGAEFRPLDWAPNGELLLSDGEWYANITENGISVELGPENGVSSHTFLDFDVPKWWMDTIAQCSGIDVNLVVKDGKIWIKKRTTTYDEDLAGVIERAERRDVE
jgi:hypothetical protein